MNQSETSQQNAVIGRSGRAGSKPIEGVTRIPTMEEAAAQMGVQQPQDRQAARPVRASIPTESNVSLEDTNKEAVVANQEKRYKRIKRLRTEQNLTMAIVMGALTSLLCAFAWAFITAISGYTFAFLALGIGFAVGSAVRYFGKGVDPVFGYVGAGFALLGCLLGNLGAGYGLIAREFDVAVGSVVRFLPSLGITAWDVFRGVTGPATYVFFIVALVWGFRSSFRSIDAA
ncbi:MAG: hypothetical protein AAF708_15145 [Deinococcota bacterium]